MRLSISRPPGSRTPLITCDGEGQVLKDFLETELQQDVLYAEYLLKQINTRGNSSLEISGNQFSLLILNNKFQIENLFDEAERTSGELHFFIDILEKWIQAMNTK